MKDRIRKKYVVIGGIFNEGNKLENLLNRMWKKGYIFLCQAGFRFVFMKIRKKHDGKHIL